MSQSRLVRYVPDVDMRKGYDGLNKIAPLGKLGAGEFIAFVNRKQTKVKLATGYDVVAYLRLPQGEKLDPRTIALLPNFFNGSKIEYDKALQAVLRKNFPKWFDKGE